MPATVPPSAESSNGANRRPQVRSWVTERSLTKEIFTARIGTIMNTTAVAGSTTVASAIVPTTAKPKPATPLTAPATTTSSVSVARNVGVSGRAT